MRQIWYEKFCIGGNVNLPYPTSRELKRRNVFGSKEVEDGPRVCNGKNRGTFV